MIISFKHKFIFLKSRKTGGTSLQVELSKHCGHNDIITGEIAHDDGTVDEAYGKGKNVDKFVTDNPHPPFKMVKEFLEYNGYNPLEFFIFTIQRNPYDVVVSRYHWDIGGKGKQSTSIEGFREWLPEYISSGRWRQDSVTELLGYPGSQFEVENPWNYIDCILEYEAFDQDLQYLSDELDIDVTNLPRLKSKFRENKNIAEFYTKELQDLVYLTFADDFINRNYGYRIV